MLTVSLYTEKKNSLKKRKQKKYGVPTVNVSS